MQLGAVEAAIASTAQAAHGLHPAEDLFDPLAHPLAGRVTGMTRGAAVERGTAGTTLIARDVWGDLERAAGRDELSSVVALVSTPSVIRGRRGNAVSSISRALLRSA